MTLFLYIVNTHVTADEFSFNEDDEIEQISTWSPARSDSVLEVTSSLDYLKHQKQAMVAYVDVNTSAVEESHL